MLTKLHILHNMLIRNMETNEMTRLTYRGVSYDPHQAPSQTLAEQMRRSDLVYRGIEHDGKVAKPVASHAHGHVYRGVRYA
jgi:hypothetical protein